MTARKREEAMSNLADWAWALDCSGAFNGLPASLMPLMSASSADAGASWASVVGSSLEFALEGVPVPEPAAGGLLVRLGLVIYGVWRRRA